MVVRIVSSTYEGYVIMYTHTRTMSAQERETLPITALPDFDLQPGKPRYQCLSIKIPRINLDHQDLLDQRRLAIKSGGTLTDEGSYIWDLALLVEGCTSENEYSVDWDNHSRDVVRLSKSLIYLRRHSPDVKFDSEGFVS